MPSIHLYLAFTFPTDEVAIEWRFKRSNQIIFDNCVELRGMFSLVGGRGSRMMDMRNLSDGFDLNLDSFCRAL